MALPTQFSIANLATWLASSKVPFARQLVAAWRPDGYTQVKFGDGASTFDELPNIWVDTEQIDTVVGTRVGPTHIDLAVRATDHTAAAYQTVIDTASAGTEFYLSRVGSGILTLDAPLVPTARGQKFIHERGLTIKQTTLYKPAYDVLDTDDVTIDNLTAVGPDTRTVGSGMGTFRGSSLYTYSCGVWSNSNRTKLTGTTNISGGFAHGVNLSSWDTATAAFKSLAHSDNSVEDLITNGQNWSILQHGQVGLRIGRITGRNFIDDSAGINPLHVIYSAGTPTVRSANMQIGMVLCSGVPYGAAVAFKYIDGLYVGSVIADDCGRLATIIDTHGFDIGSLMLVSTSTDSDPAAAITGSSPFPSKGKIRSVYINDTADVITTNNTNAINFVGNQVEIESVKIITHRANAGLGVYDVTVAGDDVTITNLKTIAQGVAGHSLSIGKSSAAATRVTVRGHETLNASRVAAVVSRTNPTDLQTTGVVIEHDPSMHRSGTFTGTGIVVSGSGPVPAYTVKMIGDSGGGGASPFPLSSGESNIDRGSPLSDMGAPASGQLTLLYFTATKTETISQVKVLTGATAAAATPTLCKIGVYSVNTGTGVLTLVASTASDTTLFAAANTAYTRTLQAPFTKVAGTVYATATIVVSGVAVPSFLGRQYAAVAAIDTLLAQSPRITGRLDSQTDLPASIPTLSGSTRKQAYCELLP